MFLLVGLVSSVISLSMFALALLVLLKDDEGKRFYEHLLK